MDVQQETETCALPLTNECLLLQHPTNAQRACAQTFSPHLLAAPLTSILGNDVHRVSWWLLHFGETAPASGCWLWCILFLFIFMAVPVDTRCLAGTGRWPGDGRREEGSWTGDNSPLIWGNKNNPLKANSDQDKSNHHMDTVVRTSVPNGDKPLPCPAGCGPPAAGRHSSCTPPSAPSSSWPPQYLPCPWHIAFPRRTEPNALPPETITARKKPVSLMVS